MSHKIQLSILIVLFIGLSILSVFVIWSYLPAIFLAEVLAIVFRSWHEKILKFIKNKNATAALTVVLVFIIFLLPIFSLSTLAIKEAYRSYQSLIGGGAEQVDAAARWIQKKISQILSFNLEPVTVSQYAKTILGWLISKVGAFFSGAVDVVFTFLLSLFILFYLLKDGEKITLFIARHSPLEENCTSQLIKEIKEATNSVIKGSLIVAILQGIASGVGFAIFGIPNPALWGGLTVIAALIPAVGTTLITLPAIIYLILIDNFSAAVGMAIWAVLVVGLMDNFLRPYLVGKRNKLHPLVTFLSVIGGINFFGPLGIIAGPLTIILLFSVGKICFELISDNKNSSHFHN